MGARAGAAAALAEHFNGCLGGVPNVKKARMSMLGYADLGRVEDADGDGDGSKDGDGEQEKALLVGISEQR